MSKSQDQSSAETGQGLAAGFVDKVRAAAREIGLQRGRMRERLAQVRAEIEAAESEIEAINDAPCTREDYGDALCAMIDASAKQGRGRMEELLHRQFRRWDAERSNAKREERFRTSITFDPHLLMHKLLGWSFVRRVQGEGVAQDPGNGDAFSLPGHLPTRALVFGDIGRADVPQVTLDANSLCLLFGEQMKVSVRRNLAQVQWPYPDALGTPARLKRIEDLRGVIARLRPEEAELAQALTESDVLVSGDAPADTAEG